MIVASHKIPGLVLTDHAFEVPLDQAQPGGEKLSVFAREVVASEKAGSDLPWLVFFQGGPGYPGPRPLGRTGWIKRAVEEYRVLLLDSRGTGRSEALLAQSLARRGGDPRRRAEYMTHFRADSIVHDAECIRRELLGPDRRWTALGQSFGGFCVVTYLSLAPEGLAEAIVTGGIPPIGRTADEVYRATYRQVERKNTLYYQRYPEDIERVAEVVRALRSGEVHLPSGERLTSRRFLQLGIHFGFHEGLETVHYLVEDAFVQGRNGPEIGLPFLCAFESTIGYRSSPIYSMLQEACYCEGAASGWAAERVGREFPEFQRSDPPHLFTGEMMYRWMFEEYADLRPMKEEAQLLAEYEGWPRLYDPARLRRNTVPLVAVIYADDMYVDRRFSEETAAGIRGARVWITNEYEHNGIRSHGEVVLDRLLKMLHE